MRLDKKDRDLLSLLYLDSRMSFTRMGKKLGLSSASVERRLKKLEEEGVINLLFANVNLTKLGLKAYRLYFKFDVMDRKTEEGVRRLFASYPRTLWGVICQGDYDVLWRVNAKNEVEVENAINLMTEKFGEKITEKTVITTTYQTYGSWKRAFGGEKAAALPIEAVAEPEELDGKDMKILALLHGNSRETTVEISRRVGLTPDAVQYRIRRLFEKKIISGYTAWYDARKLGLEYYKILIGFRNITIEKEEKFLDFCTEHNDVVFINKGIGSWDIEVDVIVRDVMELHGFIQDIKTRFGHLIGKHSYIAAIDDSMYNPLREYL